MLKLLPLLLLLHCSNVLAFGDAAILSKQLIELQKQYKELVKQVEQLTVVNDNLVKVSESIRAVQDEYETVKGFNLQSHLDVIKNDVENLTRLGDLKNASSSLERLEILIDEIERRVRGSKSSENDKIITDMASNVDALDAAIKAYANAATSAGDQNKTSADHLSGINSATSMMAAQMLAEKQKALEQKIKRTERVLSMVEGDGLFLDYLSKKGKN